MIFKEEDEDGREMVTADEECVSVHIYTEIYRDQISEIARSSSSKDARERSFIMLS